MEKIKASKSFQKRKRVAKGSEDDSDYEDNLARRIYEERLAPLPGQMENCDLCRKRFTVTPYSRAGPNGKLLCNPCGKELVKDAGGPRKRVKRSAVGANGIGQRRQIQSMILDGTYYPGAKPLMTLCIEILTKNIHLAEELGDMPPAVIDKVARKLSKHRLLDPKILNLFLTPHAEDISVYDGAKLRSDDIIRIFQMVPGLKNFKLKNGIQFKDEVMDYLLTRDEIELEGFYLHGANLLSDNKWRAFLQKKGKSLRSLRIYWTDKHVGNEIMAEVARCCPRLERLKIAHNQQVSNDGVREIAKIKTLRHLSLDLRREIQPDVYVHLLSQIGRGLQTLSLFRVPIVDNTVLDAIHTYCRSLQKLRITDSEVMTDAGFVRLFTDWANPPLMYVDLQRCRQLDSQTPHENPNKIGLCSDGFRALMSHSGRKLACLNVHACRHIEAGALEDVFGPSSGTKPAAGDSAGAGHGGAAAAPAPAKPKLAGIYPDMRMLEISFIGCVNDFLVGCIFRSCPSLRELNVFGCMKVRGVKVPRGKLLVGVPTADGMVMDGDD